MGGCAGNPEKKGLEIKKDEDRNKPTDINSNVVNASIAPKPASVAIASDASVVSSNLKQVTIDKLKQALMEGSSIAPPILIPTLPS